MVQAPIQDIWVHGRQHDDDDGGWSSFCENIRYYRSICVFVETVRVISTWRLPSSSLLVDPDEEKAEEIRKDAFHVVGKT